MRKKIFSLLLVFLLALSAVGFAACSDPGDPNGTDPDGSGQGDGTETEEEWTVPEGSFTLSDRVMYVMDRGFATGANAAVSTKKWGVGGTDLGIPFYDEELERLYITFGDTFATAPMGGTWNSNATLYTDDLDFSQGIRWEGALEGMSPAALQVTPITRNVSSRNGFGLTQFDISAPNAVSTTIPTGTISLDGVYYMFYMEVDAFSPTGEWNVYANRVVKSSDKGETWTRVTSLEWVALEPDGSQGAAPGFAQIFPLEAEDGYVYIYGIPAGRSGGVQLGRVLKENFEDFEAYEYYYDKDADGTVEWRKGSDGLRAIRGRDSSYIVPPSCGELCVTYNPYLQRYTMYYLQNNSTIALRRSVNPWGDWSSSDSIVTQGQISGLYGAFTHPVMSTHDGKRVYLLVSEWGAYNVHLLEVVYN